MIAIGLVILFFALSLTIFVKAQDFVSEFFRVNSASTTPAGARDVLNRPMRVVNMSNVDYFVPNRTEAEIGAFYHNLPNYAYIVVCGDGMCGPGETYLNCPADCAHREPIHSVPFCGDGNICKNICYNGGYRLKSSFYYLFVSKSNKNCIFASLQLEIFNNERKG